MKYEVGHYYKMPCVPGQYFGLQGFWPVIGVAHDDADIIKFLPWHYHIDVRFIDRKSFERLLHFGGNKLESKQGFARHSPLQVDLLGKTFKRDNFPKPVLSRRKCQRQWEYEPRFTTAAKWISELETAFADEKLIRHHCPHRAADLSTLPIDEVGCIECPLHGLVWNVSTGNMVPRHQWEELKKQKAATLPCNEAQFEKAA